MDDCETCGGEHVEEIHEAVRAVRLWFREDLLLRLEGVRAQKPKTNKQWGKERHKIVPGD